MSILSTTIHDRPMNEISHIILQLSIFNKGEGKTNKQTNNCVFIVF